MGLKFSCLAPVRCLGPLHKPDPRFTILSGDGHLRLTLSAEGPLRHLAKLATSRRKISGSSSLTSVPVQSRNCKGGRILTEPGGHLPRRVLQKCSRVCLQYQTNDSHQREVFSDF